MNIPIELNLWVGACVLAGALVTMGAQRPDGTGPVTSLSAVDPSWSLSAVDSAPSSRLSLVDSAPSRSILALDPVPDQPTSHVGWRSFAHSRTKNVTHSPGFAADTLLYEVGAGEVLIVDLPEELDGRVVIEYVLVHAPALSWLVDHSLMWRTMPADSGRHDVVIRADSPADTLVVSILVR